ncbi:MAG: beta-galactosidase [Armatimonadota bacterium]
MRRACFIVMAAIFGSASLNAQPAEDLCPDGSFETAGGWELVLEQGAEGMLEYDASRARSGEQSLKLTKTNGRGYLVLRSVEPVSPEVGETYFFRGWFHADEAPVSSVLMFRVREKDANLSYDSIDRSHGWSAHSFIVPAPPGEWEKRVISFEAAEQREVHLHAVIYGNPCTVWLDDLQFTTEEIRLESEKPEPIERFTDEQVDALLALRSPSTGAIEVRDGVSTMVVDGEAVPPMLYKVSGWEKAHYADLAYAGVDLITVPVQLGNIPIRPGVWLGEDDYDFTLAETIIRNALRRNPNARIILDVWAYPYAAWGDEHPDECWTNAEGQRAYTDFFNVKGFADSLEELEGGRDTFYWYPSYNSDVWREDASEAITALIDHLNDTPLGKAICAAFITGGHDGQFVMLRPYHDFSDGSVEKWHAWLRESFTLDEIEVRWGERYDSYEDIPVPAAPPRGQGMETKPPYQGPSPDLDYRTFAEDQTWTLRDRLAQAAKEAIGRPIFTLAYSAGSDGIFDTEHLDVVGHMSYYPYRRAGLPAGYDISDAYALHGKMFIQELDLRSWVGSVYPEVYQTWIGAGLKPDEFRNIHRKLVGLSLAGGHGWWYYDMHHYFAAPEILSEINRVREIAATAQPEGSFQPDVCVVYKPGQDAYVSAPLSSIMGGETYQMMLLDTSGVAYDSHFLGDVLEHEELQDYRVYIFANTRMLTEAERAAIGERLAGGGRWLVFLADSGYVTETGPSVEALSDLVGMTIATDGDYARAPAFVDVAHPLTEGVLPFQGMSELLVSIMTQTGASSFTGRPQRFRVEDNDATALAHYEDGSVAMAVRDRGDWTSAYLGAPNSLGAGMLRNIAEQAGAFVLGAEGHDTQMSDRLISLHARRTGPTRLNMPDGVERVTVLPGEDVVAVEDGSVTLETTAQETYWLLME